jgi:hypothetical protein
VEKIMEKNKAWGLRNCKDLELADDLVLDLLVTMRIKYPNDQDFGKEVNSLLERLKAGMEAKKVSLN